MKILTRAIPLLAAAILIPACGGKSGGGQPAAEGHRIAARGGTGTAGNGGDGGWFAMEGQRTAGDINLYTTGTVNAVVNIPTVAPYLGTNPRTVSSNTTIEGGPANTPTTVAWGGTWITGDDGSSIATGLWIRPGATLTLNPWRNNDGVASTMEAAYISFDEGIFIEGALVMGRKDQANPGDGLTDHGAELELSAENLVIAPTGSITTSGRTTGPVGGNGGDINFVYTSGTIINNGTVSTAGAYGDTGGSGGFVWMFTASHGIYNGGTIDTGGGAGFLGNGGNAGYIMLDPGWGGVHNNGRLLARGGNGTANGGAGDDIEMDSDSTGAVTNAGVIDTSGGSSTGNGSGGNAGVFWSDCYGGSSRFAGSVTNRGGNGGPLGGNGGNGGYIYLYRTLGTALVADRVPEGIFVGADIDMSGGDGASGGDADFVYAASYANGYARPVGITFVGYSEIDVSGGDGSVDGGDADGDMYIETEQVQDSTSGKYYGGRIYNEVPFVARGGDGATGWGGAGGTFEFNSYQLNVNAAPGTGIVNAAPFDLSGGDGGTNGGPGGILSALYTTPLSVGAEVGIVNSGTLDCRGGAGGTGTGGYGGYVDFDQTNSLGLPGAARSGVLNSGAIYVGGGSGANGADADGVDFHGDFWVRNTGDIDSTGGDGSAVGGDGYSCNFTVNNLSSVDVDGMGIVNTGRISTDGGAGGTGGGNGGLNDWRSTGSIVNSGVLSAVGGDGAAGGGLGRWDLRADTLLTNTAPIDTSGGAGGTGAGGNGGPIYLASKTTTCGAALTARGGDSTAGAGGSGGTITLLATESPSILAGSSMDAQGGAPAGLSGTITIDGVTLGTSTASY